jgi:hypothetical protein
VAHQRLGFPQFVGAITPAAWHPAKEPVALDGGELL